MVHSGDPKQGSGDLILVTNWKEDDGIHPHGTWIAADSDSTVAGPRQRELDDRIPELRMSRESSGIHRMRRPMKAVALDGLTAAADLVDGVRRRDLGPGDRLIVSTKNSVYSLTARPGGSFDVSGGWFEREGEGASRVEVRGCTAGGHAIFTDHIAVKGLFMEFADGLRTTRIRSVRMIPASENKSRS